MPRPLKLTQNLSTIFARYKVKLRKRTSIVVHAVYGIETVCSPLVFATFEAALKAEYLNRMAAVAAGLMDDQGFERWYGMLAGGNGFALPELTGDPDRIVKQTHLDYGYCVNKIMEAGLYYELLD